MARLSDENTNSNITDDEQYFIDHPPASGMPTMRFMHSNQLAHQIPPKLHRTFL